MFFFLCQCKDVLSHINQNYAFLLRERYDIEWATLTTNTQNPHSTVLNVIEVNRDSGVDLPLVK